MGKQLEQDAVAGRVTTEGLSMLALRGVGMLGLILAGLVVGDGEARAQTAPSTPADSQFVAITCNGQPATDGVKDEPGGSKHRDVVGTASNPAKKNRKF